MSDYAPTPEDVENLRIQRMAQAGQNLAQDWGHPAWSNSWAETVALAMYAAYESVPEITAGEVKSA
jgi:hypothetical protein